MMFLRVTASARSTHIISTNNYVIGGDRARTSKLANTIAELLGGHLVLVEVEAELRLVIDEGELLQIQILRALGRKLLGDLSLGVVELLEEARGDGEVVATAQLGDLANVAERRAHDDGVVAELLVVVEDVLNGLDTGVLVGSVGLAGGRLVPIHDAAHEGGDEESTGLSGGDGLHLREHEGEVGVDTVLALELAGRLDTLPSGGNLDQDTALIDAEGLVEVDDVEGLGDGRGLVEGEARVDLGGDLARDEGEDLFAELNEETVHGGVGLGVDVLAVGLSVLESGVDELGVLGLFGGREDQGGVGGGLVGG